MSIPSIEEPDINVEQKFYTCRKCRFKVFEEKDLVPHEPSIHTFSHHKAKGSESTPECTSFFIENKEWMVGTHEVSGRIDCPKCGSVLGKWKWDGTQCSCG